MTEHPSIGIATTQGKPMFAAISESQRQFDEYLNSMLETFEESVQASHDLIKQRQDEFSALVREGQLGQVDARFKVIAIVEDHVTEARGQSAAFRKGFFGAVDVLGERLLAHILLFLFPDKQSKTQADSLITEFSVLGVGPKLQTDGKTPAPDSEFYAAVELAKANWNRIAAPVLGHFVEAVLRESAVIDEHRSVLKMREGNGVESRFDSKSEIDAIVEKALESLYERIAYFEETIQASGTLVADELASAAEKFLWCLLTAA